MFDKESYEEGYSCECGGSIELENGIWSCNKCGFKAPDNREKKEKK